MVHERRSRRNGFGLATTVYVGSQLVGTVAFHEFLKVVEGSRHMLRRPPAWAFDLATLDEAEAAGAHKVIVHDRETGRTWRGSIATIRSKGFLLNRGFGAQIALTLWHWARNGEAMAEELPLPIWGK